uniref:Uncharacterized protein n=1 Tax=Physcomitrium patens TaxID=3218 RepID=A0A2K1KN92_PHYPA|nr:uncharacterized protein LOC112280951 isoform X6 [Physcomitrium patens]PNR55227.1 hypothetical protein PHYPA_006122 [Physcomitrium patens]|eukprot:XP_024372697.1 uncharacterized protein LOC112280951 isoform X6 [Physcomitrella patens]
MKHTCIYPRRLYSFKAYACLGCYPRRRLRQISLRVSANTSKVPHFFDREDQFSGSWTGEGMGNPRLSLNATPNSMNVYMDTGNPQLNCTLDSVLKISGIGAAHAATQEAYSLLKKEVPTTKCDLERIVKKAGREGLQWGMVAGIYAGIEYGMERARGKQDWVTITLQTQTKECSGWRCRDRRDAVCVGWDYQPRQDGPHRPHSRSFSHCC